MSLGHKTQQLIGQQQYRLKAPKIGQNHSKLA